MVAKMPLDIAGVREKIRAKEAEVERLQGLISVNEDRAEEFERSRGVYIGIARQYEREIANIEREIYNLYAMIGGKE